MSQYAFYLAKSHRHKNVYYINLAENHFEPHNGFELEKVFGISTRMDIPPIVRFFSKIRFLKQYKPFSLIRCVAKLFTRTIREAQDFSFDYKSLKPHRGITYYVSGWHSFYYFKEIETEIRKVFSFDSSKLDSENLNLLKRIQSEESVAIHLRRGDYLNSILDGVCTDGYYANAINKIKNLIPGKTLRFFVFSDDINYAESLFNGDEFVFVDNNHGSNSWIDMYLMSCCKHNINANSTFSWWAAWLNENVNKIVMVPSSFFRTRETPEFYPEQWIKVEK